jgi:hypothetical protein
MTVKGTPPGRRAVARATIALVAFGVVLAGRAGFASAHPEFSALGTNRYVTAAVFDGRVDVTDALLEGTLASGEERRRLDADHDGQISEAELRAGEERLRAEGATFTVEVDGRARAATAIVVIDLGDEPRASAAPVVVERRLSLPGAFPAGARRLRVEIAREPPRLLDTEIDVVLGPGLTLAAGADRVTFQGPRTSSLEERAATFDIAGPPPPPPPPRRKRPLLAAIAFVALLLTARAVRKRAAR